MSNQRWRDEYFHACGRHGIPCETARKILRHANTLQRIAELECSIPLPGHNDDCGADGADFLCPTHANEEHAVSKIRELLQDLPINVSVEFQGDPRGPIVTLHGSLWGIVVPSHGFTASRLDAISKAAERRQTVRR